MVETSGLRGRGGGGFPTGKKWKIRPQAVAADQKYLICNADEGDPGAFMDRAVIEGDPHRAARRHGDRRLRHRRDARPTSTSAPSIRWRSSGCKAAIAQAEAVRPARRQHPRQRLQSRHRHQDGRRRVRVRRRDRADPQHRRQARHAAAPPAVPGRQRPVRQADDHQQRRDAGQPARASSPTAPNGSARSAPQGEQGHEGLRPLRQGAPHGPGRSRHGHDAARRSSSTSAAASPTAGSSRPCRSAAHRAAAFPTQHLDIDDRLRIAEDRRRDDGLGRPGRHGRRHLHGRRGQVLHGFHPATRAAASAFPAAKARGACSKSSSASRARPDATRREASTPSSGSRA